MLGCAIYLSVQIYRILHAPLGYEYGHVKMCIRDRHSPVFLLNSCLDLFSAPSHFWVGTLYPEVTGSVLSLIHISIEAGRYNLSA